MAERFRVLRGISYTPSGKPPGEEVHRDPSTSEGPMIVDDIPVLSSKIYLEQGHIEPADTAAIATPEPEPAPAEGQKE